MRDRAGPTRGWHNGAMIELEGRPATEKDLSALALYNYGHFTSMRIEDRAVRGLGLHLERLAHDCLALFATELNLEHVRELVRQAAASLPSPVIARVTVFDPTLDLGIPGASSSPKILVSARKASDTVPPPIRIQACEYVRERAAVKHVGLFGTVFARRAAQLAGFDDVVFVTSNGLVSEGATWNVGFWDGSEIVWPEADVLPGVTMRLLIQAAALAGIRSRNAPLKLTEAKSFRCAFVTNAAVGVRGVRSLDDHTFSGDLAVIDALRDAYFGISGDVV